MKEKILKVLMETGGYVSGQELSEKFGVSRTAVWKAIGQLKNEGYTIEAVTNRGYRLVAAEGGDLLNQAELETRFTTAWAGRPLIYKERTGSTNDDCMMLSDAGAGHGTLVVAGEQTSGKGRRGRAWISPTAGNIYMSILLKPRVKPAAAPMLTLVMALSVYQALEETEHDRSVRFGIKWPNDIVVLKDDGNEKERAVYRKTAGILTEMRMEEMQIKDVVIGTGINVNMRSFPEEIAKTATSLCLAMERTINRAVLTASVWKHFEKDYEIFEKTEDLSGLKKAYEAGLVNIGRTVRVLDPKGEYTGTAGGITDTGELIVHVPGEDAPRCVGAGEISVRGVMDYV